MLIRPRAKIVALSLRMPPGAIVVRACHDAELFLYELVAEGRFEERLLKSRVQFEKIQEGSRVYYVWRLGRPRGVSDKEVDGLDLEAERDDWRA